MGTEETELDSTNQLLPLSMMADEIKETYIKFLCNAVYLDDGQIDSREYAEIMTLIAINSLTHESRMKIRMYMYNTDEMEDMEALLEKLDSLVPSGSVETIRLSLFKDVVNIRWDALNLEENKAAAKEDRYIRELQELLNINDDKAEFIISEIQNNKDILNKRQNDDQIKNGMKETIAKAGAVGVPMAAVYLSGSVVGVSAAGITSGLAAAGAVVGGGMAAGVFVLAAPVAALAAGGVGIASHLKNKQLRQEKERLYTEALRKHEAIIKALKEEADADKERLDYLQSLNILLTQAIKDLKKDLGMA